MASDVAMRAEVAGRGSAAHALRDATVERARALGLRGWARDDDGVVRVHAEGHAEAVEELRAFVTAAAPGVVEHPAKVEGHEQFAVRGVPAGRFAVAQRAGGYEISLEVGGGVRAWTLRKAPSMEPAQRRMAIEVAAAAAATGEDGPLWDGGAYEQGGRVPWPQALDRGHAVFVLHGRELRGGFALQRTRGAGAGSQWLLVKRRDEHAR